MEALRIIKKIDSDRIEELNDFIGKNVEIIILPEIDEPKDKKMDTIFDLRGSLPSKLDGMEFQNQVRKEWDS